MNLKSKSHYESELLKINEFLGTIPEQVNLYQFKLQEHAKKAIELEDNLKKAREKNGYALESGTGISEAKQAVSDAKQAIEDHKDLLAALNSKYRELRRVQEVAARQTKRKLELLVKYYDTFAKFESYDKASKQFIKACEDVQKAAIESRCIIALDTLPEIKTLILSEKGIEQKSMFIPAELPELPVKSVFDIEL